MTHTLIHIQSYIFIISQPKVSFQFLTFKEGSYVVLTSTYHYFLSSLTFWDCKWDPLPLKLWNESYNKCHNANDKPQVTMHVQMKCNNTWKSHIYMHFLSLVLMRIEQHGMLKANITAHFQTGKETRKETGKRRSSNSHGTPIKQKLSSLMKLPSLHWQTAKSDGSEPSRVMDLTSFLESWLD